MKSLFVVGILLFFSLAVNAASVYTIVDPNKVRLENYVPSSYSHSSVVIWWAGSSCEQGRILTDNLTTAEKNRLFAMVLTAKVTSRKIFFYYDNAESCKLVSFGMD